MPFPREIPLLKLAVALMVGICIQPFLNWNFVELTSLSAVSFVAFVLLHFKRTLGITHVIRSASIYLVFVLVGMLLHDQKNDAIRNDIIDDRLSEVLFMRMTCESIPEYGKTAKFFAKIDQIGYDTDSIFSISPIKSLVNIYDLDSKIEVGDNIYVEAPLNNTPRSHNPFAFDYSKYLKHQGIAYQAYFKEKNILKIEKRKGIDYLITGELRDRAIGAFSSHLSGENLAIALALVLGYRDLIDEELYSTFTDTGSMHVLAVSGLHVGILTTFLGFLLSFIRGRSLGSTVLKALALVGCVALFAALTGWSPSVVRASFMFSILEISKLSRGHYSVYNSIGASILLMLLIDPYNLYQVGFQLSFAAILSIVLFFPWINSWVSPSYWLTNRLWQMVSIALSVQILTFPIALHYFHQFPVYFFITGITAVFLAMIILGMGLILLLLASLSINSNVLFDLFDGVISLLVSSTRLIESLPLGLIENIHFDKISLCLVFLGLAFLSSYLLNVNKKSLVFALGIFIVFAAYRTFDIVHKYGETKILVYDTRYPMVDIIVGDQCFTYSDDRLTPKNVMYAADNYRIAQRITDVHQLKSISEVKNFIRSNNHLFDENDFVSKLRPSRNNNLDEELRNDFLQSF